jgi:hypothetical protein
LQLLPYAEYSEEFVFSDETGTRYQAGEANPWGQNVLILIWFGATPVLRVVIQREQRDHIKKGAAAV